MNKKVVSIFLIIFVIFFSGFIIAKEGKARNNADFLKFREYKEKSAILKIESADLDRDSKKEKYILEKGILTINEESKNIWQSSDDWWIDDFILADSTNDKIVDINLSVWKVGNYGPSRPFWVKENDLSIKNHFFILDFRDGEIKTIWGSSNLEVPNCKIEIFDTDSDSRNELIVVEGNYSDFPDCKSYYRAFWEWNNWGFSNEWRGEKEKI